MPEAIHKSMTPDRNELNAIYDALQPAYDLALSDLYRDVRSLLEAHGYTPTIKYRLKRFKNYFGKLKKVREVAKGDNTGPITDLLGLRIICPFLEDLDIIEELLTKHFQIVEAERKGGQNSFREFGYDSVHLLLKLKDFPVGASIPFSEDVCEIQLRTILQDAWAEVEHELVYKSDITLPNESIKRKLASLNASLSLSDLIFQEIRDYQKEIRQRGRKRRESIDEPLPGQEMITLDQQSGPGPTATMQIDPIPYSLASGLEKIMLAALNAHSQNDLETAIDLYGQLLEMKLDKRIRAMVYNHRGMAHFSSGNVKQACSDFSESIYYDAKSYRCLTNRALVYRILKKFDRSIDDYNRALLIDPFNGEGYFGRAQTYYEIQLFSKALSDCEKALEIEPDFIPAQQLSQLILRAFFGADKNTTSVSE